MSSLPSSSDIVIIGGGVMGASSAYHLAQTGAGRIVLLERTEHFEDSATNRCAGGVRYQFGTAINIQLSKISLPMIERFNDEVGIDPQYRKCGYLFVITEQGHVEQFRRNVKLQNSLGVTTEWLEGDQVRSLLPEMRFPDALAGTYHADDGLADPNSILMGYLQGARRLGVSVITGIGVTGIRTDSGAVTAVVTDAGEIACQQVINAAGPWAAEIGRMAGLEIPIEPIRRQMITTTALPGLRSDFPFVVDFAQSLYFHREGEGVLTGMSNPDQQAGTDQSVDRDWELVALSAAMERMPMLTEAGRQSGWAGLYEVTPDAHPIFGPTPLDGFWIVGGFSGHGFMHGPVAGLLMAEYVLTGRPETVDVSSLELERFEQGRLIHEPNVI